MFEMKFAIVAGNDVIGLAPVLAPLEKFSKSAKSELAGWGANGA